MSDLLGKTIGQYQLVELINEGDRNLVYKGFQPAMNRYVAVKVLSPSLAADQAFVQQFQREMQAIAGLEHPNILPVYDFGQEEGLLYMATRYVEGGTLRDHLSQFYALPSAQRMINSVAKALDYIHSQGMIHGNLKPSNILIDQEGQPLLADFGAFQNIGFVTQGNVYASPEQTQGGTVDRRTDVYALGVLLYEMLTGEPPPIGAVPSPRLRRPDLPIEVEKVILKAMAQYPEQRFQTIGEFANALNMALRPQSAPVAQPQPAPPTPQPVPAPPPPAPPRRGSSWLIFLLGGLAFLCIIAVFGLLLSRGMGGGPEAAPTATVQPTPAPPDAPPEAPGGGLVEAFFEVIKTIFESIASIIDSIFGGSRPQPPEQGTPTEEPPPDQPPPPPPEEPGAGEEQQPTLQD
jgi:serine/threonine protein kinase